jgi:stearoyl-CoA desaturase (delta-9 desaturase)
MPPELSPPPASAPIAPPAAKVHPLKRAVLNFLAWFDTSTVGDELTAENARKIDLVRVIPFIGLHVACIGIYWTGFSWFAFWTAVALYCVRMFAITGFYHRYFSHRSFKTSRPVQFVMGVIGSSSVQRGPLWWAAHHRHHHLHSDKPEDMHSPVQHSLFWSHMGWFLSRAGFRTDHSRIKDLLKFPELRLLDRFDIFVPVALANILFWGGGWLKVHYPGLGTSGPQLLFWGFFLSTVVLFHCTVTINSFAHRFGTRRFATDDDSRNNWFLALITFGEGWHNNHHHFPGSARQGFLWWEYDITYYLLRLMAVFGLVWDLKAVPPGLKRAGAA